ncbi:tRNA uracil 4-sulfurtransferase ThiI [Anaerobiospirillum thomasii]|uniref:tRNA sulfurtransferase n=1 Tax=Anaerobiospirillum thomasii TaxID=179995 RepID=A0A2X0WSU1_9GAMM|nr:tRNA uracil 4-sulfurtransferase ThiI [Anaerobiospirillum thomasii]SPT69622.1 tRNA sulfurtransferase [Anaerobiospirillum thomasii]
MKLIVRLFPEISIKSRPVRNRLIKLLQNNIINVGRHHHYECHVTAQWDKLLVRIGEASDMSMRDMVIRDFGRIPGIHSFMEISEFEFKTFEDIFAKAGPLYGPSLEGRSFAVRVKRRGNHEFTSQQAERMIGGMFKQGYANNGVSLNSPETTINIEIDQDRCYLITDRHTGLGGYPVGSLGSAMSLISGGFDSGVATYQAIRRGLKVHYLFFNMGGTAHELGVKQESYFIWDRFASSHRVKFVTVPFEPIVGQILERTHHGVRGVILKRMMVRVASLIASKLECEALVTGESLGQVSSQTLTNLSHIDRVSSMLVLRPLSMSDKQDIIDEAEFIGTADFAKSMPEYCGVISDHPNVCPKESFVLEQEALMDDNLVEQAVESCRVMDIKDIPGDTQKLETELEFTDTIASNEVVIDVRAPDDALKTPLAVEGSEVLTIPFYKIAREFESLDRLKTYALYCDQGIMSRMQAAQLKQMGYHNVKVYRPKSL